MHDSNIFLLKIRIPDKNNLFATLHEIMIPGAQVGGAGQAEAPDKEGRAEGGSSQG